MHAIVNESGSLQPLTRVTCRRWFWRKLTVAQHSRVQRKEGATFDYAVRSRPNFIRDQVIV